MVDPTIDVAQDNGDFEATVTIDDQLANDDKCLVLLCVTLTNYDVYDDFRPVSQWAHRRTSIVFKNVRVGKPGEYILCAAVTRSDGEPLLTYSGVVTVTR